MAQIGFDEVTKVYEDGTEAVRAVDLTIEDGTLMVLVGPSGCGKTTLLRMVAGLEEITGGSIRLGDAVINDVEAKNRDLAMVFQNYALYPHMTCYDNMAFGLKLRKVPRKEIDRRVRETARTLGLEDQLKKKPRALSGGQRQRVAMGRAIVREPQAFLMDEPLSNLDAKLRVQMRTEISRIQRDLGTTMIYVTHDQTEAMTMGDRVAVMNRGVLQQVDAPQDMYDRPANLFVAGFIGSPAMNMVDAVLRRDDGGGAVEFAGISLRVPEQTFQERPALAALGRQPGGAGHPAGGHRGSAVHQRPPGRVGHRGGRRYSRGDGLGGLRPLRRERPAGDHRGHDRPGRRRRAAARGRRRSADLLRGAAEPAHVSAAGTADHPAGGQPPAALLRPGHRRGYLTI